VRQRNRAPTLAALVGILAASALVAVALFSVHRPTPSPAPAVVPTENVETVAPADVVGIEDVTCWFTIPAGRNARCGLLSVPEQRGAARSRVLHLHFVVFQGTAQSSVSPLVYLAGGPGEPTQIDESSIWRWWEWFDRARWIGDRDVVVFDYRGAGLSETDMNCPELAEPAYRVFSGTLSEEQANEEWSRAAGHCRDRLRDSGLDLTAYNTEAIAEDLHTLLQQLGYRSWDFLAVSYGTRVAFYFVDHWREGTRAVILDSVYPPGAHAYVESGRAAANAFAALFRECEDNQPCQAAFPTLAGTFDRVLQRASLLPITVDLNVPEIRQVRLDSARLIDVLLYALYDWHDIANLPAIISAIDVGDPQVLAPLILRALDTYTSKMVSHGLFFSVECHDEYPFNSREAIEHAAASLPLYAGFIRSNLPLVVCPDWPAGETVAVDPPSSSDIPVLMLSGELDGITPPKWTKIAAQGFKTAWRIEFRGVGHGVLEAHECASLVVARFLDNPARRPISDCLLAMGPPPFRTPPRSP
jgi:pimeloyl-ACP methyl ester carboxylesterase